MLLNPFCCLRLYFPAVKKAGYYLISCVVADITYIHTDGYPRYSNNSSTLQSPIFATKSLFARMNFIKSRVCNYVLTS